MLETEPATFLGTASDGGGVAVTPSSLHDYNVALSNLLPASYFPTAVTQGSHGNSGESGCDFPVHYGANDPLARGCVVGGQLKPGGGGKGVVVDCKGFEGPYSRKVASGNVVGTIANAWDEHECAEKCASSDFPCFGFDYRAKVDSLGRSNTCTFTALPLGNVNNGAVNTLQTVTEEDDDHIYYAATGLCTTTAVAVNYCYPGNTKKPCTAIPPVDSSATTNANYILCVVSKSAIQRRKSKQMAITKVIAIAMSRGKQKAESGQVPHTLSGNTRKGAKLERSCEMTAAQLSKNARPSAGHFMVALAAANAIQNAINVVAVLARMSVWANCTTVTVGQNQVQTKKEIIGIASTKPEPACRMQTHRPHRRHRQHWQLRRKQPQPQPIPLMASSPNGRGATCSSLANGLAPHQQLGASPMRTSTTMGRNSTS